MMRLSVKSRLALAMGLLSALLLVVGIFGIAGMTYSNDGNLDTYTNKLPSANFIGEAELSLQRERTALLRAAIDTSSERLIAYLTLFDRQDLRVVETLAQRLREPARIENHGRCDNRSRERSAPSLVDAADQSRAAPFDCEVRHHLSPRRLVPQGHRSSKTKPVRRWHPASGALSIHS